MPMLMGGGGASLPLDSYSSLTAAWGVRRLKSSYTGNLVGLRRSSDNAEADFGYDVNGDLDVAAITTWVGEGTAYLHTWYDQSGSNNLTQTTAGNQPLYEASIIGSKPGFGFDGTDDWMAFASNLDAANFTGFMALRLDDDTTLQYIISNTIDTNNRFVFGIDSRDDRIKFRRTISGSYIDGNRQANPAVNTDYIVSIQATALASLLYLNGAAGEAGSALEDIAPLSTGTKIVGAKTVAAVSPFNGHISEIVFTSAVSSLVFEDDQGTYFGVAMA